MISINSLDMDKLSTIKGICDYHNISMSKELQRIWIDDMKDFSSNEIKLAWDEIRKSEEFRRRKPTSYDICMKIKSTKNVQTEDIVTEKIIPLISGRSFLEDRLISDIKLMKSNNPDIEKDLSLCKTVYDKVGICAVALEKPELASSSILKSIFK